MRSTRNISQGMHLCFTFISLFCSNVGWFLFFQCLEVKMQWDGNFVGLGLSCGGGALLFWRLNCKEQQVMGIRP